MTDPTDDTGDLTTHPDHDLLSDYAAQAVLSPQLAERIEEHVLTCADCAGLLAEAEGVRTALRALPPEPAPADVVRRIDYALATADRETAEPRAADEPRTATAGPPPERSGRILVPALPAPGSGTARGDRRQARAESRVGRLSPRRFLPPPRWLATAAAVLVLAGAATGIVRSTRDDPDVTAASADAGSAGSAESAGPPVVTQALRTGTDYRPDRLESQIKTLVGRSAAKAYEGDDQSLRSAADAPQNLAGTEAGPTPGATGLAEIQSASGTLLSSPTALRACLTAIGEPDAQPVAVDLARYRGQDAAVIVIASDEDSYDVWAVARDCRPGADGTIGFTNVTP
jgi:hypothetical protein